MTRHLTRELTALVGIIAGLSFMLAVPNCQAQITSEAASTQSVDSGADQTPSAVMRELEAMKARIAQLEAELRRDGMVS